MRFPTPCTLALVALLAMTGTANAIPAGTGAYTLDVVGDATNNQSCSSVTFANQTYDVFGVNVNLSTALPTGLVCHSSTVAGVQQATTCASYPDASIWSATPESEVVCLNPPNCYHNSFVTVNNGIVTGSLPAAIGSDVGYTSDGEYTFVSVIGSSAIPDCTLSGTVFHATGTLGVNAFQTQPTAVGTNQTVTFPETTFFNPLTNTEQAVAVDVSFSAVTGAGTTTVTAKSNSAATIPAGFAYSYNGFQAAFLDITTTATVAPPIEICSSYDDVDDDGYLDGTAPPIPESALSFLHGELGEFIDRTSARDPVANVICASVDHLSPFAFVVRATGICAADGAPCDDGDACTVTDVCNASLECVGSGTPDCDDGSICTTDACTAPSGCSHVPAVAPSCNASNEKAALAIKDVADPAKDQLKFQWQKGSIPLVDLGTPTASTSYTLCAFDANKMLASAVAPGGATCGTAACWKTSDKGVSWADKSKPPAHDGVAQIQGAASTAGKAKLQLKLAGANMNPLAIATIVYPVTVQLRSSDGPCWEQQFAAGDEKKHDGSQLKLGHKAP